MLDPWHWHLEEGLGKYQKEWPGGFYLGLVIGIVAGLVIGFLWYL